jgi:hypothetical protein
MRKHRKPPALPPEETSEELRARLRRFALATRDNATRAPGTATIPFPEQVTVLAGPLRRVRPPGPGPAQAGRSAGDPDRDDDGGQ